MKNKITPFEWLSMFIFILCMMNLSYLVDNSQMAFSASLMILFGFLGIGTYVKNGSLPMKCKIFFQRHNIRLIHLWMITIVGYYVIVWTLDLFMDF